MPRTTVQIDAVVVGGGIAGLWVLNVLRARGYGAVLLEAERLGGAQTLASQGIVHGGLKHALGGASNSSSEAAAQAPGRWRNCLAGCGELDLRGLQPVSEHFHLFTGAGPATRLSGLLASKALRGRVERLQRRDFPEALRATAFRGSVYRLEDFALDTRALVARLATLAADGIYRHRLKGDDVTQSPLADGVGIRIRIGPQSLLANRLILTAGAGNEVLLRALEIPQIPMQRRPLHQVIVRHANLPPLYGHWLGVGARAEPRLTITTHRDGGRPCGGSATAQRRLWYLGGRLAASGVAYEAQTQGRRAKTELETCFPWVDWRGATFTTLRVDRAEPRQPRGVRPDRAFVAASGACLVCWPTKLTLVPDLADRVLECLPPPQFPGTGPLDLPVAEPGRPPWET